MAIAVNSSNIPVPDIQFLFPNQTWDVYVTSVQGGDGLVGAVFRNESGNQVGGEIVMGSGSSSWLYSGSALQAYSLGFVYIDISGDYSQTVYVDSRVCNGFVTP